MAGPQHPPFEPPHSLLWAHFRGRESREFIRGALAAALNVVVTYPLAKLISRQAFEGLPVRAAFATILDDLRQRHLFRGIGPPLLQRALASGAMFASYDWFFHALRRLKHGPAVDVGDARAATDIREEAWQVRVGAAFLAGSSEWLLTPLERTQTLLQHRKYHSVFPSAARMWAAMAPFGLREFYRGGSAILLRNGPANALYFSLRDAAHDALPASAAPSGAWETVRHFLSGALLGAGISTLLYPINTAKMVMQLEYGGAPHRSVAATLVAVARQRGGFAGLYAGVHLNAARSLVSWGIVNAVYENLAHVI
jgi:hypothetical protein